MDHFSHLLHHWDNERPERLSLQIDVEEEFVDVTEKLAGMNGRAVRIELRDDHTLAVMCYALDQDEPVIVLLPATGGRRIQSDNDLKIRHDGDETYAV